MSQRKFEVVVKEVSHIKLTVAKDRVTLKFPLSLSTEDQEKYLTIAKKIDARIPDVEFTLRGRFHGDMTQISLVAKGPDGKEKQTAYNFTIAELE